ncbi:MAG: DUF6463 family protein [Alistipes sp.]|nr:DUF6463 family protein [Alistipes sp.]
MKAGKYSGTLLTATGILHLTVVALLYGDFLMRIVSDGLFDAIGDNPARAAAVWNFTVGLLLVIWGSTMQYYQNRTRKPAPLFTGYFLLAFSVLFCITMPRSGGWLFIPQVLIIILANRKYHPVSEKSKHTQSGEHGDQR